MAAVTGFSGFPREAFDFFASLERNNNVDWFRAHKEVYETACRAPMKALLEELAPARPARMSRINRDMRFARDGHPYKTHLSAGVGGNYISLMPQGLYVGAGVYRPEPPTLARLRAAIDDERSGEQLVSIVKALRRKRYAVDTHESVASAPKGYRPEHPRIELLRMKDLFAGKMFAPSASLSSRKALDQIRTVIDDLTPIRKWLATHVPQGHGVDR
jgi:uncharacterized protein (TIGR02453 family)